MQFFLTALALIAATATSAENLPTDLYITPVADDLPLHEWRYRQGLDFDVIHYENTQGKGIKLYMGVTENTLSQSTDVINATVLQQPIKLFKKCTQKNDCMYNTTINVGTQKDGNALWVQIWITPPNNQISPYIDWLSTLRFNIAY